MKQNHFLLALLLCLKTIGYTQAYGDSLTVKAEATVNASSPSIILNWPADADATNFIVYRKLKGAASWGTAIATLPANATGYNDATVSVNTLYDYKIQMTSSGTPVKYGYLSSGIEVKANSNRGIAILVVESSFMVNIEFQNSVDTFTEDLELDGWFPKVIYVNAADAVADVKADISTIYNEDPTKTKLLVLIGNVPVPYSGDLNPDGHPDHDGAWPTDTYYADMNGTWTDASVNLTTSANALNHNIPGDGKLDQTYLPSDVELQVGRIDLSDLPAFSETEEQLLIRYLEKDHRYKTGELFVGEQALIDDNFTSYNEGFSQSGYNNFAAIVGRDNTILNDYFGQLSYNTSTTGTYLWSYGCGGGTYTSAGGIGATSNFNSDTLSSVFTMLFGSYFGDWNYTNAFLRAPLAQGNTLTNCWAGRPNWYFNHMAMGENIGYSTRLTQNNNTLYTSSVLGGLARLVSVNLMGDPSLRLTYILQPTNLTVIENGNSNQLNWTAGGTEIGYNIYRRYADSVDFVKLNSSLVTATTFTDNSLPVAGTIYYYVKAVEMKVTPSGSFENESIALKTMAESTVGIAQENEITAKIYPNPAQNFIQIELDESLIGSNYQLINASGKIVIFGSISSAKFTLDITKLAAGNYSLVSIDGQFDAIQFVKN
ncbi:MAG: T9SS type A sorting domain-containing protein [Crocinitomicaceae bacterium]|nr:T9SS type A sorting domain-containing protein [Crocinitomicaceae bacterium]